MSAEGLYKSLEKTFADPAKPAFVRTPGFTLSAADYVQSEANTLKGYRTSVLVDKVVECSTKLSPKGSTVSDMYEQLVYDSQGRKAGSATMDNFKHACGVLYKNYEKREKSDLYKDYIKKRAAYNRTAAKMRREMREEYGDRWQRYYDEEFPYTEEATEFEDARGEVEKYEADIEKYRYGDAYGVIKRAQTTYEEFTRSVYDGNNKYTYAEVELTPRDWYECLDPTQRDSTTWQEITVDDKTEEESASSVYKELGGSLSVGVPLLQPMGEVQGKASASDSVSTDGCTGLKVSFLARAIEINFPWLNLSLLSRGLTIPGVRPEGWSNGKINASNKGAFPMYPVRMVLVKDVKVTAKEFSKEVKDSAKGLSVSGGLNLMFDMFSVGATASGKYQKSDHDLYYDEKNSTIGIKGVQVVGFCCAGVPSFPPHVV